MDKECLRKPKLGGWQRWLGLSRVLMSALFFRIDFLQIAIEVTP